MDAAAWGNGVCAGDYDDDGRLDLYVTNWGPNALFRNRGDGTFEDSAARAGVAASGWSTGCTFFDADADGDLDSTSRVMSTRPGMLSSGPNARSSGATGRASWLDLPGFLANPTSSSKTSARASLEEATDAHGLADRRAQGSASLQPTMTTTGSWMCSSPTTRTRTFIATWARESSRG